MLHFLDDKVRFDLFSYQLICIKFHISDYHQTNDVLMAC